MRCSCREALSEWNLTVCVCITSDDWFYIILTYC